MLHNACDPLLLLRMDMTGNLSACRLLMKCGFTAVIRSNGKYLIILYFPNLCFVYISLFIDIRNCMLRHVSYFRRYLKHRCWLRYVTLGVDVLSWWCQPSFYDENFFRFLSVRNYMCLCACLFLRVCGIQINMVIFKAVASSWSF